MTSQTYRTDDGQLMQDHDQVVLESHPIEPEAEPTAAEPDLAEPDADLRVAGPAAGFAVTDASEPDAQLGEPDADSATGARPWNEIQAMFVDDPRASVERAAGLVDDRVQEYIESVKKQQSSLQSAWQADDAGTEELRVALQHHRTFWNSLEDPPDQS